MFSYEPGTPVVDVEAGDGDGGEIQVSGCCDPVGAGDDGTWGPYVIRKEAWSFYRTISGVRPCWELEEPQGPKGGRADRAPKNPLSELLELY